MLQKLFSGFIIIFFIVSLSVTACDDDDENSNTDEPEAVKNNNSNTKEADANKNNSSNTKETDVNKNNNSTEKSETFEQGYNLPKIISYLQTKNGFIVDNFYPVGWSEDGKFAYIYEPVDEATGFYFFNFEIKDMRTNKIIWSWKIDEKDEISETSLKEVWKKNKKKFKSALIKNKIIRNKNFEIKQFPIMEKNKAFEISENIKYTKDTYGFGLDVVKSAEFKLKSKNKNTKTIFKESFSDNMVLNISMNTYLKSPFENIIAAVVVTQIRGYEGPPHVIRINFAGCTLD